MRRMKLSDIKIKESFANTTPSEEKMNECRYNWRMFNKQDRYIVIDHNNVLIDGYVMYKVLMEHKEEYAEVKISHCRKKRWERKNTKDWLIQDIRTILLHIFMVLILIATILRLICGVFLNLGQVGQKTFRLVTQLCVLQSLVMRLL